LPQAPDVADITARLQAHGQNVLSTLSQAPQALSAVQQVPQAIQQLGAPAGLPEAISGHPGPLDQAASDATNALRQAPQDPPHPVDAAIQSITRQQLGPDDAREAVERVADYLTGVPQQAADFVAQQNQLAREVRAQYGLPPDPLLESIDLSR